MSNLIHVPKKRIAAGGGGIAVEGGPTETVSAAASGSQSINLPSSIVAGDLLLIFCSTSYSVTTPTGFTVIDNTQDWELGTLYIWAKEAVGSDTTTFDNDDAQAISFQSFRISGWAGGTLTADVVNNTRSTGERNYINFTAITPSWGSKETLWLAWGLHATDISSKTLTDYTAFTNITSVNGGYYWTVFGRIFTASSQNPSNITGITEDFSCGVMVAVEPA
jgi:hypothetical protein